MAWIPRGDGLELDQEAQHVGSGSVDRPEDEDQRIHKGPLCSLLRLKALVKEANTRAAISSNLQTVELAEGHALAA